jgi:hypothetical protein
MEEIRNNLYNAMKAQLAALLGVNEANEAIKKMSGSEIMEMLTGYEPRNAVFNKISNLEEIRKSGKISNSDIELLKEKFDETYNNLNEVFSDDKFRAKSDGVTYYWIPEKFFP